MGITSTVAKVAAGALEKFARCSGRKPLRRALEYFEGTKLLDLWPGGLRAANPIHKTKFDRPSVLVVGAEGSGLSLTVQQSCDLFNLNSAAWIDPQPGMHPSLQAWRYMRCIVIQWMTQLQISSFAKSKGKPV